MSLAVDEISKLILDSLKRMSIYDECSHFSPCIEILHDLMQGGMDNLAVVSKGALEAICRKFLCQ